MQEDCRAHEPIVLENAIFAGFCPLKKSAARNFSAIGGDVDGHATGKSYQSDKQDHCQSGEGRILQRGREESRKVESAGKVGQP